VKGKKVNNVDHSDCSFGIVSTRRRGLGIFALAQLIRPADREGRRPFPNEEQRGFTKVRKGQRVIQDKDRTERIPKSLDRLS
jgi:hypothetical protein